MGKHILSKHLYCDRCCFIKLKYGNAEGYYRDRSGNLEAN